MNGVIFILEQDRDKALLGLLHNAGLRRLVEILPKESRNVLRELLKDEPKPTHRLDSLLRDNRHTETDW